jgi:hypothetical protein
LDPSYQYDTESENRGLSLRARAAFPYPPDLNKGRRVLYPHSSSTLLPAGEKEVRHSLGNPSLPHENLEGAKETTMLVQRCVSIYYSLYFNVTSCVCH